MGPYRLASSTKEDQPAAYPERDAINLDYRIFALLLACATRADLLDEYLRDANKADDDPTKWAHMRRLGFPQRLLAESLYVFKDPASQHALRQLQIVTRTLVSLNDYCFDTCPSDPIIDQLVAYTAQQSQQLQPAGQED
jgi:hypothetical protein